MTSETWLDISGIMKSIQAGMKDALQESGERIAVDAKRRAPIRKAFKEPKGFRRKFRALTDEEKNIATERANAYYGAGSFKARQATAHIKYYAKAEVPRRGSNNAPGASRKIRKIGTISYGQFSGIGGTTQRRSRSGKGYEPGEELSSKLTSRGKNEVRSGASIHLIAGPTGNTVQIGGALKASIGETDVVQTGSGMEIEVQAAIRYAKFVEFPTIRTSAQPFLLPALKQEQGRLARTVAENIRYRLGGR